MDSQSTATKSGNPTAETRATQSEVLPYADGKTPLPPKIGTEIDRWILVPSALQLGLAIVVVGNWVLSFRPGYFEYRDASGWAQAAWRVSNFSSLAGTWLIASALLTAGAIRARHRRWTYRLGAATVLLHFMAILLAGLVLSHSGVFRYRWVSTSTGAPVPDSWDYFVFDAGDHFSLSMMLLISNSAMLFMAVRWLFRGNKAT